MRMRNKIIELWIKKKKFFLLKAKEHYKNLSQEEKDKIKSITKKYQELVQYKKEALKNK